MQRHALGGVIHNAFGDRKRADGQNQKGLNPLNNRSPQRIPDSKGVTNRSPTRDILVRTNSIHDDADAKEYRIKITELKEKLEAEIKLNE